MTDSKPNLNIRDIYDILYNIDKDSLRKIVMGKRGELSERTKARLSKAEEIARELGWDEKGIYTAITVVLKNV